MVLGNNNIQMAHNTQKVQIALKKATSLLATIHKMVDGDKYCIDVLKQNLAVIGLLKSVNENLLEGHLKNCFLSAVKSNDKQTQDRMIDELFKVMKMAQKR